jgi:hypothetical protein
VTAQPRTPWLSPHGLALTALVLLVLHAGAHAFGLRPYTTILSGTVPSETSGAEAVVLGLIYVALHFAAVVVAPILGLAAALLWALTRRARPA